MNNPLVIIAFILIGCFALWYFAGPKPVLQLVVSEAKILTQRGFNRSQLAEAEEFFAKEFPDRSIKISAFSARAYGGFKFQVKGDLDEGEIQQIRNFLVDIT